MKLIQLIEELELQIEQATKIPLTGKVVINEEIMLDNLDRLRVNIPEEVKQAQWITKERERILIDAQSEAERIIAKAKNYVEQQANENEIVKTAELNSQKIVKSAREEAELLEQHTRAYATDILQKLENALGKALQAVQEGQSQVNNNEE